VVDEQAFKRRTRQAALRVIRVVEALPPKKVADLLGRQLLRSGTSIGAKYRAACRAKSAADMAAKLAIVEEETDETLYWLELLVESKIVPAARLAPLQDEIGQILAMTVASIKTIRARNPKPKIKNPK
jgi:four helix bundle protein